MVNTKRKETKMKRVFAIFILFGLILNINGSALCNEKEEDPEIIITEKDVTGVISVLNPTYIAIVYHREKDTGHEYEIGFPISSDIKISRKRSLDDINRGDTVTVKYDEKSREYDQKQEDGTMKTKIAVMERKATEIVFVRPEPSVLSSGFNR